MKKKQLWKNKEKLKEKEEKEEKEEVSFYRFSKQTKFNNNIIKN